MPGLGGSSTGPRSAASKPADMPASYRHASAGVSAGTTSTSATNDKPKLDPSDPRVKKLVYSMYRNMLTTRNGEANDIISKKDPALVTQDLGVGPILESIIMRQRAESDATDPASNPADGQVDSGPSNGSSTMAPPPPPPPMMPGALPSQRLNSEIGPRDKGPPAALAGAMMKDKKPFTYTPGGIDLSEIRSPRMAKRIQMNAAAEGVTNVPAPSSSNQDRAPCNLPPAALAAMQPQMAIPVFPQGNVSAVQLNRSHKPSDYSGGPPPPPPPPGMSAQMARPGMPSGQCSPQPMLYPTRQSSPPHPKSPPPPPARTPPLERAITPKSPMLEPQMGSSRPASSQSALLEELERRSPLGRKSPISLGSGQGVGTGSLFIPPIPNTTQQQQVPVNMAPSSQSPVSNYVPPGSRPIGQTKAQAVSQNIGSLYIPPIGDQSSAPQSSGSSGSTTNGNTLMSQPMQSAQAVPSTPQTAPISGTPQLNKAPTPWMNSYNRMQPTESPPYVHPGFFMPPWSTQGAAGGARTIPIMMSREGDQMDGTGAPFQGVTDSRRSSSASGGSGASGSRTPSQAATHLGRVIPIQIEKEEAGRAKGAKIIPIQIEGRPPRMMTPSTPTTPSMNPMRRVAGPPPYNNPIGLYSNQNAMDAYQRQAAEAAAGMERMNVRCESPRTDPMQSKSMRVIQQAAENELKRLEQKLDEGLEVDSGSTFHTAEPRFMGGHIPSRAFRALQTALPATGSGDSDQPPSSYPTQPPTGPVTHHIPIRQVAQSPTPQSQPTEIQLNNQSNIPPSEQRVQEPKKYMGSNIPSRSFKILQAMTSEDGQPAVEGSAETCATQNIADVYGEEASTAYSFLDPNTFLPLTPSCSSSSYPISDSCSSEGEGSANFDPYGVNLCNSVNGNDDANANTQNPWSEIMEQGWDPYSYMWYYWWYYTTCYWAGYDMTGYEYPPGWDPNYPYCPPEFFSDYASTDYNEDNEQTAFSQGKTATEREQDEGNLDRDSSSFPTEFNKSFHSENGENGYYNQETEGNREENVSQTGSASSVPKIVIDDENIGIEAEGRGWSSSDSGRNNSSSVVDSIKASNNSNFWDNNSNTDTSSSSSVGKSSYANPSTECNQKPGNPACLSVKTNDCDSVAVGKMWKCEDKFADRSKQQLRISASSNDGDERNGDNGTPAMVVDPSENSSASSSDDEYESCCEDPELKVIERETGVSNSSSNNKPIVSDSTSQNVDVPYFSENTNFGEYEREETGRTKPGLSSHYDDELNANDHGMVRARSQRENEMAVEKATEKDDDDEMEEDEDEKTDPGTDENNDDEDDYGGHRAIIEEPETPSSADDSDVTALVSESGQEDEHERAGRSSFYYSDGGLTIEEYQSETSEAESAVFDYSLKKNRLSTIDEITESRASSSVFSSRRSSVVDASTMKNDGGYSPGKWASHGSEFNLVGGEEKATHRQKDTVESDSSDESSDELSSVSVIENKSDATRATTESKGITSTSDDNSSDEDKNVDEVEDDDDDEDEDAGGADTAVTVRLPLRLCFTKTKSYKDITTVMVGDSEIEEISQASSIGINEPTGRTFSSSPCHANDPFVYEDNTLPVDEIDDDEPVVSFTLSLSRQTSREDDSKARDGRQSEGRSEKGSRENDSTEADAADIDFWAEITKEKASTSGNDFTSGTKSLSVDEVKSNQDSKKDYGDEESGGSDMGFWGVICRDRSVSDFPRSKRKANETEISGGAVADGNCNENGLADEQQQVVVLRTHKKEDKHNWDPQERIDYKWEKDFNFWEKSSRTIETRRFSGNFEITEDYESDTGIKPSSEKKDRVKKYTHKRHSISGTSNGSDRSSLPPRPVVKPSAFTISTSHCLPSGCTTQEIKTKENESFGESNNDRTMPEEEKLGEANESLSVEKIVDPYQKNSTESSWWSYWDEVEHENGSKDNSKDNMLQFSRTSSKNQEVPGVSNGHGNYTEIEDTEEKQDGESSAAEVSLEMRLSRGRSENNGETDTSCKNDYQSCHISPSSNVKDGSSVEANESVDWKSQSNSCQSDATDNEDYSSSPEIKCSLRFPCVSGKESDKISQQVSVSDENSDESSSRSSGTTIQRQDNSESKTQLPKNSIASPTIVADPIDKECKVEEVTVKHSPAQLKAEQDKLQSGESYPVGSSTSNPPSIDKCVEIHRDDEQIKLDGKEHHHHHHHIHHEEHYHHHHSASCAATSSAINTISASGTTSVNGTSACTCLMSDRIARAENLLWRIERFLHESLSLGSEDDSGVMTDLSRQISDVDTDVDNDLNETEFLLTAAAVAKEQRRVMPGFINCATSKSSTSKEAHPVESCNFGETLSSTDASLHYAQPSSPSPSSVPNVSAVHATTSTTTCSSAQVKKPRPKSDIFSETALLSQVETEETTNTTVIEESNGVKMRSASERRALRYQRAKTHSRLFQLLQDECCRDDEPEEFDYESDVPTPSPTDPYQNPNVITVDCEISVDSGSGDSRFHQCSSPSSCKCVGVNNESSNGVNGASPTGMNDSQARRSRLLPLPIKNLLATSLSLDSNSSPSGSSGVLSPTSPVNRDQLLADIINEFHLRNQASSLKAQNQRRISTSFPSKIFKLLQHEFGEEFYQTFDCCGGGGGEETLISPSMSSNLCVNDLAANSSSLVDVHECTIHKSDSMKEFEEATNRILTNFMLRNTTKQNSLKTSCSQQRSESPNCTAKLSSEDDSKYSCSVDFLDVPQRKKKGTLTRDLRNSKSTKK